MINMDASSEVLYFQTTGLKLYNNLVLNYQTLSVVIGVDDKRMTNVYKLETKHNAHL